MSKERLFDLIEGKKEQYTKAADQIWSHPETRYEEKLSSAV